MIAEQGQVTGAVPLTPIELRFLEAEPPEPNHFNWATLVQAPAGLHAGLMGRAVRAVLEHHDALRLRLSRGADGSWGQFLAAQSEDVPFESVDLSGLPPEEQRPALEALAAGVQVRLDLAAGPLLRVVWFNLGASRPGRLLVVVHRLAADEVSCRVLLDDLRGSYRALRGGREPRLPPKTTSFKEWAEHLKTLARSGTRDGEAAYWLDVRRRVAVRLPVDRPDGDNSWASAEAVTVTLQEEQTRALLEEVPRAAKVQPAEVLLTALAVAVRRWAGPGPVLVNLEGHGREEVGAGVNVLRTVGWFTSVYPMLLDVPEAADLGMALRAVQEQMRSLPGHGIGYGLLRYLGADAELRERLAVMPEGEVLFNYFGQVDGGAPSGAGKLGPAPESLGPTQSVQGRRRHLLEVSGGVQRGQLLLRWNYSANLHERATVARLTEDFLQAVRELIDHCLQVPQAAPAPEDFPLAALDQADLAALLKQLSESGA